MNPPASPNHSAQTKNERRGLTKSQKSTPLAAINNLGQKAWLRLTYTLGKKAIMQRGSIEHEQIIYESSNRRMKQLMDWLSNSH